MFGHQLPSHKICLLGMVGLLTLAMTSCGDAGTQATTDPADYAAVIKAASSKGPPNPVAHFPAVIPSSATSVQFRYHPGGMQAPLAVQVTFTLDEQEFQATLKSLSLRQSVPSTTTSNWDSRFIPEEFDGYILGSKPGRYSYGAATNNETREVVFWSSTG